MKYKIFFLFLISCFLFGCDNKEDLNHLISNFNNINTSNNSLIDKFNIEFNDEYDKEKLIYLLDEELITVLEKNYIIHKNNKPSDENLLELYNLFSDRLSTEIKNFKKLSLTLKSNDQDYYKEFNDNLTKIDDIDVKIDKLIEKLKKHYN